MYWAIYDVCILKAKVNRWKSWAIKSKIGYFTVFYKPLLCVLWEFYYSCQFHCFKSIYGWKNFFFIWRKAQDTCGFPDRFEKKLCKWVLKPSTFFGLFWKVENGIYGAASFRKTTPGNCIMKAICLGVTPLLKVWYSQWLRARRDLINSTKLAPRTEISSSFKALTLKLKVFPGFIFPSHGSISVQSTLWYLGPFSGTSLVHYFR